MRILLTLLILFSPFVASASESENSQPAKYLEARKALDSDPQTAFTVASSLKKFRHADDVRLDLLAEAALRTQQFELATKYLASYAAKTSDPKEAFRATLDRAEVLALLGDAKAASRVLSSARKQRAKIKLGRGERRYFDGRVLRLQHDLAPKSKRPALAKKLLIRVPTEPTTRRAGLALSVEELSDAERFSRAVILMDTWAYTEARSEFERLEKISKYKNRSSWNLGVIALRKLRDRPEEAEERFKKLSTEKGFEEQATWYWARALMRQNKYDEVFEVYDLYEKKFPRGRRIHDIFYYRGWLPYDARENQKAITGLKKYVKRYGKRGAKSTYIYGFLAWAHMREGEWKNAIKVWDDMLTFGNILVAGKALYWKAVAQSKLKQNDDAKATLDRLRARYPLSYYGMLGEQFRAKMDGKSAKASEVWWPEKAKPIDDSPTIDVRKQKLKLKPATRKVWNRVLELVSLDETHLAREAFKPIAEEVYSAVPASKRTAFVHAVGWYIENFNTMWKVAAGSISSMPKFPTKSPLKMVMAYPRAYKDVVQSVGHEFDVPDVFVWSIMRQESRYKPSAISYTDAVGALQMIPKTARLVAADIGTTYDLRTFFRPEVGFRFSGYYMQQILSYFDGHFVPAAAAYNTGPKVIAGWFHKNPKHEFDHLIEEFEYNEGRAYCRKVNEHMLRYIYLYVDDEAQRAEMLDKMFPESRDFEVPQPEDIPY